MRTTSARPTAYDPYGQPLPAARALAHPVERHLRIPVLLFWAAALALVAGRLVLPVELPGAPAATAVVHTLATPS